MFKLTLDQFDKLNKWCENLRPANCGAIGGRFTYKFTPTTIGLVVKVIDNISKEEIDLSDYD